MYAPDRQLTLVFLLLRFVSCGLAYVSHEHDGSAMRWWCGGIAFYHHRNAFQVRLNDVKGGLRGADKAFAWAFVAMGLAVFERELLALFPFLLEHLYDT